MIGNCIRCGDEISDVYLVCTGCAEAQFEDNLFWIATSSVIGKPVIDRYRADSEPTLSIGERHDGELIFRPGITTSKEVDELLELEDPKRILYRMNLIMAELGLNNTIDFNNYLFSHTDVEIFSKIFTAFEIMEHPPNGLPEQADVYLRLANLFFYTGKCADTSAFEPSFRKKVVKELKDQAEKYYKKAVDLTEDSTPSTNLGHLYLDMGALSEAEECFKRAIELDETDVEANLGLADYLMRTGDTERADGVIDSLIVNNRNNAKVWYLKGKRTQANGRWGGAVQLYDQAYSKDRNMMEALVLKGRVLLDEGMYDEANWVFDQIIEKNDMDARGWFWKAKTLYIMEKWGGALQCIHEALSIDAQMPGSWELKGDILMEREVFEEALVAYNNALDILPKSKELLRKKEACERSMD